MADLELKEINYFSGTEKYYRILPWSSVLGTDGVNYIQENGYSWFVTDTLIKAEELMKKGKISEEVSKFLTFKLKINKKKEAAALIEDGDGKKLYYKKYSYSDAKKELTLFLTNGVLMLANEY